MPGSKHFSKNLSIISTFFIISVLNSICSVKKNALIHKSLNGPILEFKCDNDISADQFHSFMHAFDNRHGIMSVVMLFS